MHFAIYFEIYKFKFTENAINKKREKIANEWKHYEEKKHCDLLLFILISVSFSF